MRRKGHKEKRNKTGILTRVVRKHQLSNKIHEISLTFLNFERRSLGETVKKQLNTKKNTTKKLDATCNARPMHEKTKNLCAVQYKTFQNVY